MTARMIGLLFAMGTALLWGAYGPAIQRARLPPGTAGDSPFKVFVLVGVGYLVWGILGGLWAVGQTGGDYRFTGHTLTWGLIAGTLGSFGALSLTFAIYNTRDASLVMPVVYGGATAVAAIITILAQGRHAYIHPLQGLGFVFVVAGVALIQKFAASPAPVIPPPAAATTHENHDLPANEASRP